MPEASQSLPPLEIEAPASKSLSHRYLIGAALARGQSKLKNILESADISATRQILTSLGAKISPLPEGNGLLVNGLGDAPAGGKKEAQEINVQESGTTCRLLTAVLAAGEGLFRISGTGRMHERPIGELCAALGLLGAKITYQEKPGCPPLLLEARRLNPALADGHLRLALDQSSQFFSGLLLASPLALGPLVLEVGGRKAVSWPYVGLTLQCLADFGIRFQVERRARPADPWESLAGAAWRNLAEAQPHCLRVRLWPGAYHPGDFTLEGDWSQASYFLAAGALGKRPVRLSGIRSDSLQGDRAILAILRKMGARIELEATKVTVFPSALHGVDLDMGACPDLVPTVAVLAAYASGSTRIHNVGHLRLKESDRIDAPARELAKCGVTVDALSDGLLISGLGQANGRKGPKSPKIPESGLSTHNDHRMAMSLALIGLRTDPLALHKALDDASVVKKSFPGFWELWAKLA